MPVENYKIGKYVLENLTSAMYKDSRIIYREYVQNSADAIDKAIRQGLLTLEAANIYINIDVENRSIFIEDNATGIAKNDVKLFLGNIADSMKDKDINKGFRGIGRLGGLAYCKKLIFETSSVDENIKTIMTFDAALLQKILDDNTDKSDAAAVMNKIVNISFQAESADEHYFKVSLIDIKTSNSDLLAENEIREYLGQVAPVDFEKTRFQVCSDIKKYMNESNNRLDSYNIQINGEYLYKIYTTKLIDKDGKTKYDEISGIETKEFYDDKGDLLAWCWIGISNFIKRIPPKHNSQGGIRLKKENIQIGDSATLNELHREPDSGNRYFIGEVHAVHNKLIPNAHRDYFIENETLKLFEDKLKSYFGKIYDYYRYASNTQSAIRKQKDYTEKLKIYKEKSDNGNFTNIEEKNKFLKDVNEAKIKALDAQKQLDKIIDKSSENKTLKRVVTSIKEQNSSDNIPNEDCVLDEEDIIKKPKEGVRSDKLNKLKRSERKLVSEIYFIIQNLLDPETAESIIGKIEEKYK